MYLNPLYGSKNQLQLFTHMRTARTYKKFPPLMEIFHLSLSFLVDKTGLYLKTNLLRPKTAVFIGDFKFF
jgi:hypothetical protein